MKFTKVTNPVLGTVLCGMFIGLYTLGAKLVIHTPLIAITFQTFLVLTAGVILGSNLGAISVIVYLILGLVGLPIFASGGGPQYIFMPSFGYMIGFVIAAFITGFIVERYKTLSYRKILIATFCGVIINYVIGMAYQYFACNFFLDNPVTAAALFTKSFLLTFPKDIVLCFLSAYIGIKIIPIVQREGYIK